MWQLLVPVSSVSTVESKFPRSPALQACGVAATVLMLVIAPGSGFAQGHYEATPTPSITIERSSEHKTEDQGFEIPVQVQLKYESVACEAKLSLEYFQRGENAQVSTTLTNTQCEASYGSYTVQVRYRGEDQELQTHDYEETWERMDSVPLLVTKQYFIGDDVDLVRVRTRGLTCTCEVDGAADAEEGE